MQFTKTAALKAAAGLAALGLAGGARGFGTRVRNQCAFPIHCRGAKGPVAGAAVGTTGEVVVLAPGAEAGSFETVNNDNVGVSVKCAIVPADLDNMPYQLEVAEAAGILYYDLSSIDGDPFLPYPRTASLPGTDCPGLACAPGDGSCEWPFLETCTTEADVLMTLC